MIVETEALVRDYLGRLDVAAQALPAARRRELRAEIGEHIDAALAEEPTRNEVAVRNVLERLGQPEDIVAAEVGTPSTTTRDSAGIVEVGALVLLASGTLLTFVLGLGAIVISLIGLALAWVSPAWMLRQKAIATVALVALLLLPYLVLLATGLNVRTS
jgi:uncharacterized membrane protein